MKCYVVGFLIEDSRVCLIEKTHPDWQKGRLNGVGGHIEQGETPLEAMAREFVEEAGYATNAWREYCLLGGLDYEVHCFVCKDTGAKVTTKTDEKIAWYPINSLPDNIIPNLAWLIPMANYKFDLSAVVKHENPEC